MKKILLLLLLLPVFGFSQFKQYVLTPNKTTVFGLAIPKNQVIIEVDSFRVAKAFYMTDSTFASAATMSTVFTSGKYFRFGVGSAVVDTSGWSMATRPG